MEEVRVFGVNRGRMLLLVLGMIGFGALSMWMTGRPGEVEQKVGWMGLVFGAGAGLVGVVQMLPGAVSLTLDREGFVVRHLFRDRAKIRWRDVTGFSVWTINRSKVVGYDFVFGHVGESTSRAIANVLGTPDRVIHNSFEIDCVELAALMEEWRRRNSA